MKLSFVIPAYNEERYLGKCLTSVLKEIEGKPYDIEVIVVNNASTDKTGEVARAFEGVKVVNEPQKGLTKARQAGYKASTGDLIANVDADTILPPGWIDRVFEEFSNNDDLAALSGPYIYYDLSEAANALIRFYYYLAFTFGYLISNMILRVSSMIQGGNFILRRSALEKIGGYNTSFDFYGEDTDIAHRISKVGKVKFTFRLPMYTSGRRLKAEGELTMAVRYSVNYFWTIIMKRPFTKEFSDVRPEVNVEEKFSEWEAGKKYVK